MAQLFVGQLPFNKFYPNDLLDLFQPYGKVIAQEIHIRKGNGFVMFGTTAEADAAIQALHGKYVVPGRHQPLQVTYSKSTKLISEFGCNHRNECLALWVINQNSRSEATTRQPPPRSMNLMNTPLIGSEADGPVLSLSPYPLMQSPLSPQGMAPVPPQTVQPFPGPGNLRAFPIMASPQGSISPQAVYPPVPNHNLSQPAMLVVLTPSTQSGMPNPSLFNGSLISAGNSSSSNSMSVPPPVNVPTSVPNSIIPPSPEAAQYMYHPLGFIFQQ